MRRPSSSDKHQGTYRALSLNMPLRACTWSGVNNLAETEGFEPSIPLTGYDDLANRCLQPLGHVSGRRCR